MPDHFSQDQLAVIDADNPNMAAAGFPLGQVLNDLYADIAAADAVGIQSLPADVDSVCGSGREFTIDYNTSSPMGSLVFAWKASQIFNGKALIQVPAGSITL